MNFSQFTTWLFDVDGTLINSIGAVVECVKQTVRDMGGEVTDETVLMSSFGKGLMATLKPWVPEEKLDAAMEQYMRNFHHFVRSRIELSPGVTELLELLKKRGVVMGIVTGNKKVEMEGIFQQLSLESYFGAVVCADSIPFQKPSPEPVLECLRLLNRPVEGAIFVGDSEHDIRSGRLAGVKTIAVKGGSSPEERLLAAQPDFVVESMEELLSLV